MLIPVLLIGALAAFAIAASSKAKATLPTVKLAPTEEPLELPIEEAEETIETPKVTIETPSAKKRKAKKAIIKASKTEQEKEIAKKIEEAPLPTSTPEATEALKSLIEVSQSETAPPAVKKAAKKKVKKIAAKPAELQPEAVKALPVEAKKEVAKAIIENTETIPTADQGAHMLQVFLKAGGNQGTKASPSETVAKCQQYMGFTGKDVDGIVGPNTRARAASLGYTLPPRSAQIDDAAKKLAAKPAAKKALPAPKTTATEITVVEPTAKKKAKKKKVIKAAQTPAEKEAVAKIEQAELPPSTPEATNAMKNLLAVSVSETAPPAIQQAAKEKVQEIIATPTAIQPQAINALPAESKAIMAKSIVESEAIEPTADQAAQMLQVWTKNGGNQGSKTNKSATVARCQRLMGFSEKDSDGIIGPMTRDRAKALGYPLAPRSAQKPGAVGAVSRYLQY